MDTLRAATLHKHGVEGLGQFPGLQHPQLKSCPSTTGTVRAGRRRPGRVFCQASAVASRQVAVPATSIAAASHIAPAKHAKVAPTTGMVLASVQEFPDGSVLFKYAEAGSTDCKMDPSVSAFLGKGREGSSMVLAEIVGAASPTLSKTGAEVKPAAAPTSAHTARKKLRFDPFGNWLQAMAGRTGGPQKDSKASTGGAAATLPSSVRPNELQTILAADLPKGREQLGLGERLGSAVGAWGGVGPAAFQVGMELQVAAMQRAFTLREVPWIRIPQVEPRGLQAKSVGRASRAPARASPGLLLRPSASMSSASPPGSKATRDADSAPLPPELPARWRKTEGQFDNLIWVAAAFAGLGLIQLARVAAIAGLAPLFRSSLGSALAAHPLRLAASALPGVTFLWVAYLVHKCRGAALGLFEFVRAGVTPDEEVLSQLDMIRSHYMRQVAALLLFFVVLPITGLAAWRRPLAA